MNKYLAIAAVAASAVATPAFAQDAQIDARALILQPATIVAGDNLDFGTVLGSPTDPGSVTIGLTGGNVTVTPGGGVTSVTGAQAGSFRGNGTPRGIVEITVNYPAVLRHVNGVDVLPFSGDSYGAGRVTIPADGLFNFLVGGRIDLVANQAPGQYTAKVEVDANFQ